jgi:hypothetical protein
MSDDFRTPYRLARHEVGELARPLLSSKAQEAAIAREIAALAAEHVATRATSAGGGKTTPDE